jgi:NitT/TauT family transport system permease protein
VEAPTVRPRLSRPAPAAFGARARNLFFPVASAITFLLAWEVASLVLGADLLPSPLAAVLAVIKSQQEGYLWSDLGVTAFRVLGAFLIAFLFSVAVGALLGFSTLAAKLFGGWVTAAASIPSLVCVVMVYLVVGVNDYAAMIGAALVVAPSMIDVIWNGMRAINPELTEMARAFRIPRAMQLRRVVLPQATPFLFAAARSGLSSVWRLMIFVELVGRSSGVGYRIQYFYSLADMPRVLGSALPFVALMLAFEFLVVRPLERRAFRWRKDEMR